MVCTVNLAKKYGQNTGSWEVAKRMLLDGLARPVGTEWISGHTLDQASIENDKFWIHGAISKWVVNRLTNVYKIARTVNPAKNTGENASSQEAVDRTLLDGLARLPQIDEHVLQNLN